MANYSPILATGGGLLFNGSMDRYLRALDADNGQVLWQTRLPSQVAGGAVTFSVNGRQYIAVAAGGGPIAAFSVGMTPRRIRPAAATPSTSSRCRNSMLAPGHTELLRDS